MKVAARGGGPLSSSLWGPDDLSTGETKPLDSEAHLDITRGSLSKVALWAPCVEIQLLPTADLYLTQHALGSCSLGRGGKACVAFEKVNKPGVGASEPESANESRLAAVLW